MLIFSSFFSFSLSGEIIASVIAVLVLSIISVIIYFKVKHTDPLARPHGIVHLAEIAVTSFDKLVENTMGKKYHRYSGYFLAVFLYMMLAFTMGLIGLPTPLSDYLVPFSLSIISFTMLHITAIRANHWKYFKRFTEPFAVFLPVNLISMWGPLISLSFRVFGNAVAGWALMGITYWGLENLSQFLTGWLVHSSASIIFIAPLITPWLHLYFDLFVPVIQTIVFIMLSMIFISNEDPDYGDAPVVAPASVKVPKDINKERIEVKEN